MIQRFVESPSYNISSRLLHLISRIERAQGIIDGSPLLPIYERGLQNEAFISSVYASTHIEGNYLGKSAVAKLIAGEDVTAKQRDVLEIVNYRNVLQYVEKVYQDKSHPFNDVMIREFHRVLMHDILPEGQLGEYRSVQNYIVDAKSGKTIYTPPKSKEVPLLMLKSTDWLANVTAEKCHPVVKAAVAHYMIEAIHPFIDGNGRVGRVVAMFLLYRDGYDTRRLFSLEEYYDRNVGAYYVALQSVLRSRGDATAWIEYFVGGFCEQIESVAGRIQDYLQEETRRGKNAKLELSDRQYKAVRWLQKREVVSAADYAKHFDVSKRTANYDLSELARKGVVRMEGESRATKFRLV